MYLMISTPWQRPTWKEPGGIQVRYGKVNIINDTSCNGDALKIAVVVQEERLMFHKEWCGKTQTCTGKDLVGLVCRMFLRPLGGVGVFVSGPGPASPLAMGKGILHIGGTLESKFRDFSSFLDYILKFDDEMKFSKK